MGAENPAPTGIRSPDRPKDHFEFLYLILTYETNFMMGRDAPIDCFHNREECLAISVRLYQILYA